jgi:ribosome-associated protein
MPLHYNERRRQTRALEKQWYQRKKMQKVSFELNGEFVELNQLLKLVGLCDSGGAGKMMVASGAVKVDGKQEMRKTAKIRAGQQVTVGDVKISVDPV